MHTRIHFGLFFFTERHPCVGSLCTVGSCWRLNVENCLVVPIDCGSELKIQQKSNQKFQYYKIQSSPLFCTTLSVCILVNIRTCTDFLNKASKPDAFLLLHKVKKGYLHVFKKMANRTGTASLNQRSFILVLEHRRQVAPTGPRSRLGTRARIQTVQD